MKPYEVLVILPAALDEEGQANVLDRVGSEVERLGGEIRNSTALGKRSFARPMKKQENGYYYRLDMSLGADQVAPLLARLKLAEDVFRVQILRATPRKDVAEESAEGAEVSTEAATASTEAAKGSDHGES